MYDKTLTKIQRVAAVMGLAVPPANLVPDLVVMDPISIPFTISSGALTGAGVLTDLTSSEVVPFGIASTGVLKSAGSGQAFVGFVYGLSAIIGNCSAADAEVISRGYQAVVKCGNQTRSIPFSELLRYNPGRAVSTTATATTLDVATGCPSAPGKAQYVFPGQAMPWTARRGDDQIGIVDAYAAGTVTAAVHCQLIVYLVAAPGEGSEVTAGSLPGITCGSPDTVSGVANVFKVMADFSRNVRGGR